MNKKKSSKLSYQLVVVDILIFLVMMSACAFATMFTFFKYHGTSETTVLGLYIAFFVAILAFISFYLFAEYKFNRLKFNKVFIAFGIVIALSNLISVLILPSHLILPNDQVYDISVIERIHSILWGFIIAFFPYLFVVLFPRRVNSRGYVNLLLKLMLAFSAVLILVSFILDRNSYVHLFTKGFFHLEYEDGLRSFVGHHNVFGYIMLLAIMASISLHIRKKNWKWSLCLIPLIVFLSLSTSKNCIALGLLIVAVHLIVRLVILAKKSRDNLIITLLVSSFVLLLVIYLSVMMSLATSGFLFKIKDYLVRIWNNASNTLASRSEIWKCSFNILNTNYWSYIFGFGGLMFPNVLCLVYANNPGIAEPNIYWAHNGVIELLCQGGVILLLIYAILYVYLIYMAVKLYKKQPLFIGMSLLFILIFIVRSMFESSFLFGKDMDIIATIIIATPIINEYNLAYKKEQDMRNELVKQSKAIKDVKFKNIILAFNKKCLMLEAKYIAYDINSKIKL